MDFMQAGSFPLHPVQEHPIIDVIKMSVVRCSVVTAVFNLLPHSNVFLGAARVFTPLSSACFCCGAGAERTQAHAL